MLRRSFVLGGLVIPASRALAQNSFLTPGGASVPGIVTMCLTGNVAAPCTSVPAPPQISGMNPTVYADFVNNSYLGGGAAQTTFAAWMTAIGGTYSRSSTATYLQSGVIKTAAAGAPRFPTDLGGNPTGIRLTGAVTNVLLQSNGFNNNGNWGFVAGVNPPVQNVTGPDGVANSGWTFTAASGNGGALYNSPSVTQTTSFLSVFAKAGSSPYVYLLTQVSGVNRTTWFNVATGTVGTVGSGGSAAVHSNPIMVQLANGWWRCGIAISGAVISVIEVGQSDADASIAAAGSNTLFVYGAQVVDAGTFPTDYIPTTTAAVTQAADSLSFPYAQTTFSALVGSNNISFDSTIQQRILDNIVGQPLIYLSSATGFSFYNGVGGLAGPAITNVSNPHKFMVAGNPSNTWLNADGITPTTAALAINPGAPVTMTISSDTGGGSYSSATYSQLGIWNGIVASNADMIRLTT